jgi:hypothetical protein
MLFIIGLRTRLKGRSNGVHYSRVLNKSFPGVMLVITAKLALDKSFLGVIVSITLHPVFRGL